MLPQSTPIEVKMLKSTPIWDERDDVIETHAKMG
jgi:hypothetical protein